MKITKRQTRRIIKEDLERMLSEAATIPSRNRMKELKAAAWTKVSERVAFLPYDVRSVRIVPHRHLSDNERVDPEFEDQMMMRVYVKDRNGRNPVFDVVMNLVSGRAEGVSEVK